MSHYDYLAFDIETICSDRGIKWLREEAKYYPRGNLKDPKKIEADIENKKQEAIGKGALNWWTGQVVCICTYDISARQAESFYGIDEKELLVDFFGYLTEQHPHKTLIGKSSDYFDIPYLKGRAMYHDIGVPKHLRTTRVGGDIDAIFHHSSFKCSQITTLDNYAFGIGVKGKTAHGAEVKEMVDVAIEGNPQGWKQLAEYCSQDVAIAAEMLSRYSKSFEIDQFQLEEM